MPIQPTLDTEIETLTQVIASKREHITRAQYITEVQPMKDELVTLIADNEIIKTANKVIEYAPTAEEINKTRKKSIADGIAEKYTQADEISMMRKLITGESLIDDMDIQEWLDWVNLKKAEHPKVV